MKALVFAAGLGTRLAPITDTMPKALVPIAGQPLLAHVLRKLVRSGCSEIVVNVHHFPEQIQAFLASQEWGARISVSDESALLLETGGGILHARPLLEPCHGPFLVHNVDIISNVNLQELQQSARRDALATLVVSERQTSRYLLFSDDMRLLGWTDIASGEVRSPYPGLDPTRCRKYAFAGIHSLSPRIFTAFGAHGFSGRFPIMDFYLKACATEPIFGFVPPALEMVDVGKFDTLEQAERTAAKILLQNR